MTINLPTGIARKAFRLGWDKRQTPPGGKPENPVPPTVSPMARGLAAPQQAEPRQPITVMLHPAAIAVRQDMLNQSEAEA